MALPLQGPVKTEIIFSAVVTNSSGGALQEQKMVPSRGRR